MKKRTTKGKPVRSYRTKKRICFIKMCKLLELALGADLESSWWDLDNLMRVFGLDREGAQAIRTIRAAYIVRGMGSIVV